MMNMEPSVAVAGSLIRRMVGVGLVPRWVGRVGPRSFPTLTSSSPSSSSSSSTVSLMMRRSGGLLLPTKNYCSPLSALEPQPLHQRRWMSMMTTPRFPSQSTSPSSSGVIGMNRRGNGILTFRSQSTQSQGPLSTPPPPTQHNPIPQTTTTATTSATTTATTTTAAAAATATTTSASTIGTSPGRFSLKRTSGSPSALDKVLTTTRDGLVTVIRRTPVWTWNALSWTTRNTWFVLTKPREAQAKTSAWWGKTKLSIKEELHHYWTGSKLLVVDFKIAWGLFKKVLLGNALTRRERQQLSRSVADLFRLVPFAVIVVVPFAELSLPVLLKLFPNMLPSTFEQNLQKEEKIKKELKAKIEFAKFLNDTLDEMVDYAKAKADGDNLKTVEDFQRFIDAVRRGRFVHNNDIIRFSKMFKDDFMLDNLPRSQLVPMCKLINVPPYGPDSVLRIALRSRMRQIKSDDREIQWEGVHSLNEEELRTACLARGILWRAADQDGMRKQLRQWVELSHHREVPASLMILSRTFQVNDPGASPTSAPEALQHAMSSMDENLINTVVLNTAGPANNEQSIAVAKREQALIESERIEGATEIHSDRKSDETVKNFGEMLSTISASTGAVAREKEDIDELKSDREEIIRDVAGPSIAQAQGIRSVDKELAKLLDRLEKFASKAEVTIGDRLNIIDRDKDGVISIEELQDVMRVMKDKSKEQAMRELIQQFDPDHDGKVLVRDIEHILEALEQREKSDLEG